MDKIVSQNGSTSLINMLAGASGLTIVSAINSSTFRRELRPAGSRTPC